MKDIQGVQRGKCNSCECEEFRASPDPRHLRCEYCNHTPGEHVKIVELGACQKCGQDDCDKYVSEDPNSYTDCQYCGCSASCHAGADACELNLCVFRRMVCDSLSCAYSPTKSETAKVNCYLKQYIMTWRHPLSLSSQSWISNHHLLHIFGKFGHPLGLWPFFMCHLRSTTPWTWIERSNHT